MAVFTCPQCGHSQAVDDKHAGKNGTCPKCKTQGQVQPLASATSESLPMPSHPEPTTRRIQHGKIYVPYKDDTTSLMMEWIVIDDPRLPVQFSEECGVIPSIDSHELFEGRGEGFFCYQGEIAVRVRDENITAYEMRFLLFDVWGSHVQTLSAVEVRDLMPFQCHRDEYRWTMSNEAEGREHHASIGYIARVRTQRGLVLNAETAFVLREAQRFAERFTEANLEPKAPRRDA
jgi:hypothetical protein